MYDITLNVANAIIKDRHATADAQHRVRAYLRERTAAAQRPRYIKRRRPR